MPPKKKQRTGKDSSAATQEHEEEQQEEQGEQEEQPEAESSTAQDPEGGDDESDDDDGPKLRDTTKIPLQEYVGMHRPHFDYEVAARTAGNEKDDDDYGKGFDAENKAGVILEPAKDHPEHKWVIMWEGYRMFMDYRRRSKYCSPDRFDMYDNPQHCCGTVASGNRVSFTRVASVPINLPSASSAGTCLAAATEVGKIVEEFLRKTDFLTNPQFAFCLFVCGRMLIAHSFYYHNDMPSEFDSLVSSLQEMSRRWNGLRGSSQENLASKFAMRLEYARQSGVQATDMRQAAYSEYQALSTAASPRAHSDAMLNASASHDSSYRPLGTLAEVLPVPYCQGESPDSMTLAFPPLPLAFQAQPTEENQGPMSYAFGSNGEPQQRGNGLENTLQIPPGMSLGSTVTFEDMASYLDYPFLPDQRVSVYQESAL